MSVLHTRKGRITDRLTAQLWLREVNQCPNANKKRRKEKKRKEEKTKQKG